MKFFQTPPRRVGERFVTVTDVTVSGIIKIIKAAYFALRSLAKDKENISILLRIDNQTAISCINRGGSVKYSYLDNITKALWQWCEKKCIIVFASYISSSANFEADRESRFFSINTEYELNDTVYNQIIQRFGSPEIDLFATRINKKCNKFVSWFPDPESWKVDAFTIRWSEFFFYAFPPFSIITRVLEKIVQEKGLGIVVVPYWPTQAWYPLFTKLLLEKPIYFKANKFLLVSPFRDYHPLHEEISLVVGKLSGRLI